jgi:succinate-semialdehyde dehydrogenase/glutarate-semialdehyde dehydrogenase
MAEKLSHQLEKSLQQEQNGTRRTTRKLQFPTNISDFVDANIIAFQEETFGPLATIIKNQR